MSYDKIRTKNGVTVYDDNGTTRYQDVETGRFLSADDAQSRLRGVGGGTVLPPEPDTYDFGAAELEPIQNWPRRRRWKAVVGQPIEAVNWSDIRDSLSKIWDDHDGEFTHFYAGITVTVTDGDDSFETELKTLTMDTRTDSWPMSLKTDFGSKLEQLYQWADSYDTVFVSSVQTVGKVHSNA